MLTASLVEYTDKILEIIRANQESLSIHSIFLGDQEKLPGTPVVCVEPDTKANILKNATRGIEIQLRAQIIVYTAMLASPEQNRRDADVLAEDIETILHANPTLDGLVIHSLADEVASGYASKAGTLVRANKIQFTARSQSRLPS